MLVMLVDGASPRCCLLNELFFFFFFFGLLRHYISSSIVWCVHFFWAPSSAHEPLPFLHWVLSFDQTLWKIIRLDCSWQTICGECGMKKLCGEHMIPMLDLVSKCAIILPRLKAIHLICEIFPQCVQKRQATGRDKQLYAKLALSWLGTYIFDISTV